jgi:hypothetical protein
MKFNIFLILFLVYIFNLNAYNVAQSKPYMRESIEIKNISQETIKVTEMLAQMVNSVAKYYKSNDINDFRKATEYFGNLFFIDYFMEDFKELKQEKLYEIFYVLKYNLNINDQKIVNAIANMIEKLLKLKCDIDIHSENVTKMKSEGKMISIREENRYRSKVTNAAISIWWSLFDIINETKLQIKN